jgi:hypothetical protein
LRRVAADNSSYTPPNSSYFAEDSARNRFDRIDPMGLVTANYRRLLFRCHIPSILNKVNPTLTPLSRPL